MPRLPPQRVLLDAAAARVFGGAPHPLPNTVLLDAAAVGVVCVAPHPPHGHPPTWLLGVVVAACTIPPDNASWGHPRWLPYGTAPWSTRGWIARAGGLPAPRWCSPQKGIRAPHRGVRWCALGHCCTLLCRWLLLLLLLLLFFVYMHACAQAAPRLVDLHAGGLRCVGHACLSISR